jgi:pyrroline-5-carboxylate reductase
LTYAKEIVFDHKTRQSHHLANKIPGSVEESIEASKDADIEAWRVGTLKTVDMMDGDDILAVKYVSNPNHYRILLAHICSG